MVIIPNKKSEDCNPNSTQTRKMVPELNPTFATRLHHYLIIHFLKKPWIIFSELYLILLYGIAFFVLDILANLKLHQVLRKIKKSVSTLCEKGPIVHFIEGRSLSRHKQRLCILQAP